MTKEQLEAARARYLQRGLQAAQDGDWRTARVQRLGHLACVTASVALAFGYDKAKEYMYRCYQDASSDENAAGRRAGT